MKFTVTYEDGNVITYKVKPRHLVAFEDEFGGFTESVKATYTMAWYASGTAVPFDEWLDTVEDITALDIVGGTVEVGDGEPVPTG